jgi:hypothetical protein
MTDERFANRLTGTIMETMRELYETEEFRDADDEKKYVMIGQTMMKHISTDDRITLEKEFEANRIPGFREVNDLINAEMGMIVELAFYGDTGKLQSVSLVKGYS